MARDFFGNLPVVSGMGFTRGIKLLDDCEGTMTYTITDLAGDEVHEYATAAAFTGEKGLRLKTRTTGAAQNDYVWATKAFDWPESGVLIARARIAIVTVSAVKQVSFQLNIDNGSRYYQTGLFLLPSTSKVDYIDATGVGVEIATQAFTYRPACFYTVEFIFDCLSLTYISAMVNGVRVDLSDIPPYDSAATSGKAALFLIGPVAAGAAPAEIYADNIYVGEYPET